VGQPQELANLCVDTIDHSVAAAQQGIDRIGNDKTLAFGFLRQTGLSL
jgi:hypothetical protein